MSLFTLARTVTQQTLTVTRGSGEPGPQGGEVIGLCLGGFYLQMLEALWDSHQLNLSSLWWGWGVAWWKGACRVSTALSSISSPTKERKEKTIHVKNTGGAESP